MGPPDIDALAERATTPGGHARQRQYDRPLVEWADRPCLLAGDAHPDVLTAGLDQLVGADNVLEVDVFKLPHHGSKANVTLRLLPRVRAGTYVSPLTAAATSATRTTRRWPG